MVAGTCEGAVVLSWDQRLRLVMDAARGLVFLHGESISYQYLKSRNVLIFDGIRAKIKDVNLCCRNSDLSNSYPDSGLHLTTMAGAVTTTGRKYFNRVMTMAEAVKTMCVLLACIVLGFLYHAYRFYNYLSCCIVFYVWKVCEMFL